MKRSFQINKGFSLIELLVVVAIIGVLSAVGVVAYSGYIAGVQRTNAQNDMQAIYMVQEEFRASNTLNLYYTGGPANDCDQVGGNVCTPAIGDHADMNDCLFGGNEQLDEDLNDATWLFCVANGDPSGRDGGFWIRAERADDPTDFMVLNGDNEKVNW